MATGRVPTTANSPLTAKGDLFTYSTAPARLAVGNNGDTIVADSSTSTGLRYTAGTVSDNPVLNSAFQIWQRGTSATNQSYLADRWQQFGQGSIETVSRQATGDTTNLPFIQYCARIQRTAGQTGTSNVFFAQTFESVNSIPFAGKTVTLSFYARAGANFSSSSNVLSARVFSGTGTDQNVFSGFSGATLAINQNATLTTTWQRFSYTGTMPTNCTQMAVDFLHTPTGTAGANDYFEVTGVQIDVGSVALPFRTNGGTIQGELAACQRYYYLHAYGAIGTASMAGMGFYQTSGEVDGIIAFPVTMRTTPTAVVPTGTNYYGLKANNTVDTFNDLTLAGYGGQNTALVFTSANVSGTAGQSGFLYTNNASASIAFSSEL